MLTILKDTKLNSDEREYSDPMCTFFFFFLLSVPFVEILSAD